MKDLDKRLNEIQAELNELRKMVEQEQPDEIEDALKYKHLLPEGYEFCKEEQAEKWVKVELLGINTEAHLGEIYSNLDFISQERRKAYRPIRKIKPESNPYAVDWSNAPEWADVHYWDANGNGYWFGTKFYSNTIGSNWVNSNFTLPSGLDWKQSKTRRPV